MKNICLITPEIGKDKGGIQNWMYFVKELLLAPCKIVLRLNLDLS